MLMRDVGNGADVNEAQSWIARGFDPDEFGVLLDKAAGVNFDCSRECDADAVGRGYFGEVAVGATIYV